MSILKRSLAIEIVAFGFKHGVPDGLDLLFDVRFLRNPNYETQLEALAGTDPAVGAFIAADPSTAPFLERLFDLIDFLLPRYAGERSALTIGIGCTGGHHRSVYVASRLFAHLESDESVEVRMETRDIKR